MVPSAVDVEAFIAAIANHQRRADTRTLCAIMEQVTGEPAVLWAGTIIGFGSYRYRYPSGRGGTAPLASFAPRKQYLVIYLIGGFQQRHVKQLADIGPHKAGEGCLYITRLDRIDIDTLRELVERSVRVRSGIDRQTLRSSK
jgi:hypothetical protein